MIDFVLKYWIQFLFGLISSFIIFLCKMIKNEYETIKNTKNGMKVLLKKGILEKYKVYKEKNCITFYEKEMINDLYQEYKNLGGNSFIEDIMDDINDIPMKNDCGGE
jgi:hypothetical protein